jgi:hypothetical protein
MIGPLAMNTLQPSSTSWEMNCKAMKPKATKGRKLAVPPPTSGLDEAQAEDEGAEADGDPKRAEHGAPIALPDVEQADRASLATGREGP